MTEYQLEKIKNAEYLDKVYLSGSSWFVIGKENGKTLLLRSNGGKVDFNSFIGGWENSSLRKMLNEDYYQSFDEEVKKCIVPTQLNNLVNPNDITTDKVFILSKEEMEKYIPSTEERGKMFGNFCTLLRNLENKNTYYFWFGPSTNKFIKTIYENGKVKYIEELTGLRYSLHKEILEGGGGVTIFPAMWIDIVNIEEEE